MNGSNAQRRHQRRERGLFADAMLYLIVNGFFVGTWTLLHLSGVAEREPRLREAGFYPGWLMLWWGVFLGIHALIVWLRRPQEPPSSTLGVRDGRVVRTVLFTDIVDSTERAEALGDDRWGEVLDLHDRVAHRVVSGRHGEVVKQTGDGMLAVFETPRDAIVCAETLRDELTGQGLQIRAGVHTGEIDLRGRDVRGVGVHIASRVMDQAEPSEILVSSTVRDLASGSGVAFADRGLRELKGLQGEWHVFAVEAA